MSLSRFARAIFSTSWRRLRRGPLQAGWGFGYEVSVAFLRETSMAAAGRPPAEQRRIWSAVPAQRTPYTRKVALRPETIGGVACQWITPPTVSRPGAIIYAHGGSFIFGGITSYLDVMARIACATEMNVLYVEYALVPERPYPAAIDDLSAVFRALRARGEDGRLVIAGDSAGGNLALTVPLRLAELGEALPDAAIAISPWVDLTRFDGSLEQQQGIDWGVASDFELWADAYAREHDRGLPTISPLFADLSVLPPTLLLYGSSEMLYDQDTALADRATAQGAELESVVFEDMVHGWLSLCDQTPEGPKALERIAAFVARLT